MKFERFFKDKDGNVVLAQFPNWPIFAIVALSLAATLFESVAQPARYLVSGLLFYWGVLELWQGADGFRRVLGLVAIGYSIWRLVQ